MPHHRPEWLSQPDLMLFRLLMKFEREFLGYWHEWGKRATAEKAIRHA